MCTARNVRRMSIRTIAIVILNSRRRWSTREDVWTYWPFWCWLRRKPELVSERNCSGWKLQFAWPEAALPPWGGGEGFTTSSKTKPSTLNWCRWQHSGGTDDPVRVRVTISGSPMAQFGFGFGVRENCSGEPVAQIGFGVGGEQFVGCHRQFGCEFGFGWSSQWCTWPRGISQECSSTQLGFLSSMIHPLEPWELVIELVVEDQPLVHQCPFLLRLLDGGFQPLENSPRHSLNLSLVTVHEDPSHCAYLTPTACMLDTRLCTHTSRDLFS